MADVTLQLLAELRRQGSRVNNNGDLGSPKFIPKVI